MLLLVDRAVRRLVDEPEAKELDADDGRDEGHHREGHEAHDLSTEERSNDVSVHATQGEQFNEGA